MYSKKLLFCSLLFFLTLSDAFAQEPLADRMEEHLKSEEFNVSILLQSLGIFNFTDGQFNGNDRFDVGATRLVLSGQVDKGFLYKLQTEFRDTPSILDAQVGYAFSEKLSIVGGAYKVNMSYDLDPNPGQTDLINRARQVGTMMNSREIGVTLEGQSNGFDYRFGMYNGTALSRQNDGNFLYAGRLGYTIDNDNSMVKFGVNAGINQTDNVRVGNTGQRAESGRTLMGVYADIESGNFFGTFELLQTQFDLSNNDLEQTITGFYGTLGLNVTEKDQILGRLDHLTFHLEDTNSDLVTIGWNRQFTRLFTLQINALLFAQDDLDNQYGLNANFQFQF